MAGDWIKMRTDLYEDPAVIYMAGKIGEREEVIVGYCHKFWSWVDRQCHAPSVTGVTLEALGRVISLPNFPQLLREVGWLEYEETADGPIITIPKFDRHLSQSAKSRALAADRKRRERTENVSRTERDKSVTREEKRRIQENPPTPLAAQGGEPEKNGSSRKRPPTIPYDEVRLPELHKLLERKQVTFPESLRTERLGKLWNEWVDHRQQKQKRFTIPTITRQLSKLASLGESQAAAALEHSITQGYDGVYEADRKSAPPHASGKGQPYFDQSKETNS